MKKLILIAFLSVPFLATAQNKVEEVVLKDGRIAVLYDNGLWIYKEPVATKSTPINSLTSPNKPANSKSSSSTTRSTSSSTCGAPTKKGGACRRLVSGGGRCWQHS